jgi:microsomal dipeptidase-like Zn-dependent dipeptidase
MTTRRRNAAIFVLALLLCASALFLVLPAVADRELNPVSAPPRVVSAPAMALHRTLRVADLHADSLLWGRDLLERGQRGHVDLPRLVDGNVVLQVFSVVTKTPRHLNIYRNDDRTDNILPLAVAQRWPTAALRSLKARALYQAGRLAAAAAGSHGGLVVVRSAAELEALLAARTAARGPVGAVLSLEGSQALEGDLTNLDALYEAGFRMIAASHFYDTEIGGSSAGVDQGGLTALGRRWLAAVEAKGMIVDLAHASSRTVDDVLALATRPVVVSHTGVRATCDKPRNLSDDQVRRIAAAGGLIGIGYWPVAVCGDDPPAIARAIAHVARLVGVDHVALGSDFDGAVAAPFDAARLAELTDALLGVGLDDSQVRKVMGENALAFLGRTLPGARR